MQGVRTLYSAVMDDLETEKINEGITNLAGTDIMPVRITTTLRIHILSLKEWFQLGSGGARL